MAHPNPIKIETDRFAMVVGPYGHEELALMLDKQGSGDLIRAAITPEQYRTFNQFSLMPRGLGF
jgi:hypothetical protein